MTSTRTPAGKDGVEPGTHARALKVGPEKTSRIRRRDPVDDVAGPGECFAKIGAGWSAARAPRRFAALGRGSAPSASKYARCAAGARRQVFQQLAACCCAFANGELRARRSPMLAERSIKRITSRSAACAEASVR